LNTRTASTFSTLVVPAIESTLCTNHLLICHACELSGGDLSGTAGRRRPTAFGHRCP
jgi:hypothetical protein